MSAEHVAHAYWECAHVDPTGWPGSALHAAQPPVGGIAYFFLAPVAIAAGLYGGTRIGGLCHVDPIERWSGEGGCEWDEG